MFLKLSSLKEYERKICINYSAVKLSNIFNVVIPKIWTDGEREGGDREEVSFDVNTNCYILQ